MQNSKQSMWKGYRLSIEGLEKRYFFSWKMVYKKVRGWTSGGGASQYKHVLSTPRDLEPWEVTKLTRSGNRKMKNGKNP